MLLCASIDTTGRRGAKNVQSSKEFINFIASDFGTSNPKGVVSSFYILLKISFTSAGERSVFSLKNVFFHFLKNFLFTFAGSERDLVCGVTGVDARRKSGENCLISSSVKIIFRGI